jgi:hypothetical protein
MSVMLICSLAVWWHSNQCDPQGGAGCSAALAILQWWWSVLVYGILLLLLLHVLRFLFNQLRISRSGSN